MKPGRKGLLLALLLALAGLLAAAALTSSWRARPASASEADPVDEDWAKTWAGGIPLSITPDVDGNTYTLWYVVAPRPATSGAPVDFDYRITKRGPDGAELWTSHLRRHSTSEWSYAPASLTKLAVSESPTSAVFVIDTVNSGTSDAVVSQWIVTKFDSDGDKTGEFVVGQRTVWQPGTTVKDMAVDRWGSFHVLESTSELPGWTSGHSYLTKYAADGSEVRKIDLGYGPPPQDYNAHLVTVDPRGAAYVMGTAHPDPGGWYEVTDYWVAKYDTQGNRVWFTLGELTGYDEAEKEWYKHVYEGQPAQWNVTQVQPRAIFADVFGNVRCFANLFGGRVGTPERPVFLSLIDRKGRVQRTVEATHYSLTGNEAFAADWLGYTYLYFEMIGRDDNQRFLRTFDPDLNYVSDQIPSMFCAGITADPSGGLYLAGQPPAATGGKVTKSSGTGEDGDGDGLLDDWEKNGFVGANGKRVDLPAMGADPMHKDIFVEVDYVSGQKPSDAGMYLVMQAFDRAPVGNPDGKPGINLHIDSGPDSVMNLKTMDEWGMLSHSWTTNVGPLDPADKTAWRDVKNANMEEERKPIFHYCLMLQDLGGPLAGRTGFSYGIPHSDFVTALGVNPSMLAQSGTFMHELGHNLGLGHGGSFDHVNFKPNYLSIMNYAFQCDGLMRNGKQGYLDYSRVKLADLDENALDEQKGIGTTPLELLPLGYFGTLYWVGVDADGNPTNAMPPADYGNIPCTNPWPIDWNANHTIDAQPVAANINGGPATDRDNVLDVLYGAEDWSNLRFVGGSIGAAGAALRGEIAEPEAETYTKQTYEALAPDYRVRVVSPDNTASIAGSSKVCTFTVANIGKQADTYDIAGHSAAGWADPAVELPTSVYLQPGQTRDLAVTVAVPAEAARGAEDSVKVVATSQGNPLVLDDASVRVVAKQPSGAPTEVRLTNSLWPHSETNPKISGDKAVWLDQANGTVVLYDIPTGDQQGISGADCLAPDISGNTVVWADAPRDAAGSGRALIAYDISTGTTRQLTFPGSGLAYRRINRPPAISGNRIAYCEARSDTGLPAFEHLYVYDLSTGTDRQIAPLTSGSPRSDPAISGNRVAYWDLRAGGGTPAYLYVFDLEAGTETKVPNAETPAGLSGHVGDSRVMIEESRVAWPCQHTYHDGHIITSPDEQVLHQGHVYDLDTHGEQITPAPSGMSDGHIIWVKTSAGAPPPPGPGGPLPFPPPQPTIVMDLHLYDLATETDTRLTDHATNPNLSDVAAPSIHGSHAAFAMWVTDPVSHEGNYDVFMIDNIPSRSSGVTRPPATAISTAPSSPDAPDDWFKTNPLITLTPDEPRAVTYYQWDGTGQASWSAYGGPFHAPEGEHTLYFYSTDAAGNKETVQDRAFKVDSVAPETRVGTSPRYSDGWGGWFKSSVEITFTTNEPATTRYQWDATSPAGWIDYSARFAAPEGEHTLYFYSTDTHGNAEQVRRLELKIDTATDGTPPATTMTTDPTAPDLGERFSLEPTVALSANEEATIYVQLDRTQPGVCPTPDAPKWQDPGAPLLTATPGWVIYNGEFRVPLGEHTLYFYAIDNKGNAEDAKQATLKVGLPVNLTPALNSIGDQTVDEAQTLTFFVSASDPEGNPLSWSLTDSPQGAVFDATTGLFSWTPTYDQAGIYPGVTFEVSDGASTASESITITVNNVNRPPSADGDNLTTDEDTAKGLVLVATDPDGDALTYTVVDGPAHGSLAGTVPNLTYTPAANFHGADSFTYKANDGEADSTIATVDITVDPANDKPVANPDGAATSEDEAVEVAVLANDSDIDGDRLSIESFTQGSIGGVTAGDSGALTYTPAPNRHGSDLFTYTVSDGHGGTDTASVRVDVASANDDPVLAGVGDQSVDEASALTVPISASDVDGDSLDLTATGLPPFARLTDHGDGTGALALSPGYEDAGVYGGVNLAVSDGTAADSEQITITVGNVNRSPVADDVNVSADEDVITPIALSGTDPDGDALTYLVTSGPSHGELIGTGAALSYVPDADYHGTDSFGYAVSDPDGASAWATVNISVASINDAPELEPVADQTVDEDQLLSVPLSATDADGDPLRFSAAGLPGFARLIDNGDGTGAISVQPGYDDAGTYGPITVEVSDGAVANRRSFMLTVTNINRLPVAEGQSVTTDEDTVKDIALSATDADGETVSCSILDGPVHGTLSGTAPSLTYTPNADYHGADSFTFKANDGAADSDPATVDITVSSVNDTPVATAERVTTSEDNAVTIDVLGNDSDADGDTLSITAATTGSHGSTTVNADGTITYTPDAHYNVTDWFSYKVSDGNGATAGADVQVDIAPVNDAPVLHPVGDQTLDEAASLSVSVRAFDIDGDGMTLTASGLPLFASLADNGDGTGTLALAPGYDDAGTYPITVSASDGTETDSETIVITVCDVNRPPMAAGFDVTADEDAIMPIFLSGSDPDGDALTYMVTGNTSHGTLVGAGPALTYAPDLNYNGIDTLAYSVTDPSGASASATVRITVNSLNDDSVAADDDATTPEDTPVTIAVLANDTDPDGDTLSVASITQPAHGAASANPDGTITYAPAADYNGVDAFTYTTSDGHGSSATATVRISISAANDSPTANAGSDQAVDENTPVRLAGAGSDIDGDPLTCTWTQTGGPAVSLNDSSATSPTFTAPEVTADTVLTFSLAVSDGTASAQDSVNVTVRNVATGGYERARSKGYWKNHPEHLAKILARGPIDCGDTIVKTVPQAVSILAEASTKDARYMLRAQLLATLLNLGNNSDPMALGYDIRPVASQGRAFLVAHTSPVTSTHPDRASCIAIKDKLDRYNNSGE